MINLGYVLDDTVIRAYLDGSDTVTLLLSNLAAQPMQIAVPAVAMAVAQSGHTNERLAEWAGVVENVENIELSGLGDIIEIGAVSVVLGDLTEDRPSVADASAAHTAAVAAHLGLAVLTVEPQRWAPYRSELPWLEVAHLAEEPDDL
ncbi:hypothetical protein SAMN04244553_4028 [Nocardia amikacinitolerans]|uniref:PIN domain-containing protein n=1 Tax=Nocardia amikacinitolerans TaxID=756689 RepID=A0A285LRL5_9NOCA|nr:hypothetical protein [Nocardia amikacinitolerans]MCP2276953.1 hypothetical protein [Nocardia amikacinitolerans]MCP2294668.1 hypothetical protein [Nocardia amikacinitolerans]SNY87093.1 hypothetical protein SAMN04244553_4028 [Nocardia amikacinitolerans]